MKRQTFSIRMIIKKLESLGALPPIVSVLISNTKGVEMHDCLSLSVTSSVNQSFALVPFSIRVLKTAGCLLCIRNKLWGSAIFAAEMYSRVMYSRCATSIRLLQNTQSSTVDSTWIWPPMNCTFIVFPSTSSTQKEYSWLRRFEKNRQRYLTEHFGKAYFHHHWNSIACSAYQIKFFPFKGGEKLQLVAWKIQNLSSCHKQKRVFVFYKSSKLFIFCKQSRLTLHFQVYSSTESQCVENGDHTYIAC